jgi:hypothetical protein
MTQATRVYATHKHVCNREGAIMTLERPMFPPVNPTRRHLLTIAAGGAVALTAMPAVDPIYAAIERHKEAAVVWNAAVDVWAEFPDGPELWVERERIHDAWCDARNALDDTGVDLINTAPATLGGIARALNYIREQMLQDDGIYMRIASPKLLPETGPLPHLICSRQSNLGSGDEEGEHGDTSGIDFGNQGALRLDRATGKGKDSG